MEPQNYQTQKQQNSQNDKSYKELHSKQRIQTNIQFQKAYEAFFNLNFQLSSQNQIQNLFNMNEIYLNHKDSDKLQLFQCISHQQTNNYEVVKLKIKLSCFKLSINILNIKGINPLLSFQQSEKGHFGKVYYLSFLQMSSAIKLFHLQNKQQSSRIIFQVIKEYCILKICSILKCGPALTHIFGFDLVIYDDSVMFSMEKCSKVVSFDKNIIQSLKFNLYLMHKYKILHLDIKPDNILFSFEYNRPIFIDFGFSEVIEQSQGMKTLISFKGSPAYCSPQMVSLLVSQQMYSYIDLYFNDVHALKISIHVMKSQKNPINNCLELDDVNIVHNQEFLDDFLTILLRFELFCKRKDHILKLLKYNKCYLISKFCIKILQYFANYISFDLFQAIYSELHKQFQKNLENLDIKLDQTSPLKIFSIAKYNKKNEADNHALNFHSRLFQSNVKLQRQFKYEKFKEYLSIKDILQRPNFQDLTKNVLIACLRFDVKNISTNEKIQYAKKFNKFYGIQQEEQLNSVRNLFKYLMEYCLSSPHTLWKKGKIFTILSQFIILDINLQPYHSAFIKFLEESSTQFSSRIFIPLQLLKCIYIEHFKIRSDYQYMKNNLFFDMQQFAVQSLNKLYRQFKDSEDNQKKVIVKVIFEYLVNKATGNEQPRHFFSFVEQLNKIGDSLIKKQLYDFIYLEKLEYYYLQQDLATNYKYFHIIKDYLSYPLYYKKSMIFDYSTYYLFRIFAATNNNREMSIVLKNIIQTINEPQICQYFKFQMTMFAYSSENDCCRLLKYTQEIINTHIDFLSHNKLSNQFMELIEKIKVNKEFLSKHSHIINQIFQTVNALYTNYRSIKKPWELTYRISVIEFQRLMSLYNIFFFFCDVLPNFQTGLKVYISKQTQFIQENHYSMAQQKYLYYQIHINLAKNAYYYKLKMGQKQIQSCQLLYNLCEKIGMVKGKLYFLKRTIVLSNYYHQQAFLSNSIYKLYNVSDNFITYGRYFKNNNNFSFIYCTIYCFYRKEDYENIYKFLINLSKFITKFPFDLNVIHWCSNIDAIMEVPGILHLTSYSKMKEFINYSYWNNYYLAFYFIYSLHIENDQTLKIKILINMAYSFAYLSKFSRKIILKQYYSYIIPLYSNFKRKKRYLITKNAFHYLPKIILEKNIRLITKNKKKKVKNVSYSEIKHFQAMFSRKTSSMISYR